MSNVVGPINEVSRVKQSAPPHNTAETISAMQGKSAFDGGDEEPSQPGVCLNERLECEATQEELQLQGQGLQTKRQEPGTNRTNQPQIRPR